MSTFRVYEVQNEIITRKWMYEVEALDENVAMSLVRDGQVDPIDCGTLGEPFNAESGFAVSGEVDSNVDWNDALTDLESYQMENPPKSMYMSSVAEAIEAALNYFEDTRHGKEWIEAGGVEVEMLHRALKLLGTNSAE